MKSWILAPTHLRETFEKVTAITALSLVLGLALFQSGCATGGDGTSAKAANLDSSGRSALQELYLWRKNSAVDLTVAQQA